MKDLGSLIQHPSFQGGDSLILASGKPIILTRRGEKKGFGQPINNQNIMILLKASFPPDVVAGFQWGRELQHELTVADGTYPVRIVLKPDKSIIIEITLTTPLEEEEEEPEALPISAPDPGPEVHSEPVPPRPARPTSAPAPSSSTHDQEEVPETLIEELTSGEGLALIFCTHDRFNSEMEQSCVDLGFNPKRTTSAAAVKEVLKYHDYPLFIMQLDENFAEHPVYQNLISLNMDRRRTQFSVLIAPGLRTADAMDAFSLSVNMVVDPNHMTMLFDHLQTGITSWKRFVGTFHELLKDVGRL